MANKVVYITIDGKPNRGSRNKTHHQSNEWYCIQSVAFSKYDINQVSQVKFYS